MDNVDDFLKNIKIEDKTSINGFKQFFEKFAEAMNKHDKEIIALMQERIDILTKINNINDEIKEILYNKFARILEVDIEEINNNLEKLGEQVDKYLDNKYYELTWNRNLPDDLEVRRN